MNETSPQLRSEINDDTAKKRTFPCENCGRTFSTKGGRTNHQRKCKNDQNSGGKRSEEKEENEEKNETVAVVPNGKTIDVTPNVTKEEKFYWGQRKGSEFTADFDHAYGQIVCWRQNLFFSTYRKVRKEVYSRNYQTRQ